MLLDVVLALRYYIYAIVEISVGVHRSDDQHSGCGMPYFQVPLIFNFVGRSVGGHSRRTFAQIERVVTRMIIEQDLADDTLTTR